MWPDADLVQGLPSRQLLGVKRTCYARCEIFRVWPKCMVRPCVARGFVNLADCGLALMYPASVWSVLCSGPSWISARMRA